MIIISGIKKNWLSYSDNGDNKNFKNKVLLIKMLKIVIVVLGVIW